MLAESLWLTITGTTCCPPACALLNSACFPWILIQREACVQERNEHKWSSLVKWCFVIGFVDPLSRVLCLFYLFGVLIEK